MSNMLKTDLNGLWTIEFATANRFGKGVIVFSNGKIFGGDSAYYYSGILTVEHNEIKGDVNVTRYDPLGMSVLGDIETFNLFFKGTVENDKFFATGYIPERPDQKIIISGNKKVSF